MEHKIVSAYVYKCNGLLGSKNDKAQVTLISCNAEKCKMRDKGHCIQSGMWERCLYGKSSAYKGYTKRARGFHDWISKQEEKYKGVPSLGSWDDGLCEVGDHIYLPYSQLSTKFENEAWKQNTEDKFIEIDKFNSEFVYKLTTLRPRSMMGGQITSYQRESVPRMLGHVKERYNDIFNQLIKEHPDVLNYLPKSNIGRKAFLNTLRKGCIVVEDGHEFVLMENI